MEEIQKNLESLLQKSNPTPQPTTSTLTQQSFLDSEISLNPTEIIITKDPRNPRKAKIKFPDGRLYEGDINPTNNDISGAGTMIYSSKKFYKGQFFKGKKHGKGILITENSNYEGDFLEDKKHGEGTYRYSNGNSYSGGFKEDLFDGFGFMDYSNGDRYNGDWRAGKMNGKGTYRFKDGKVYTGAWKEGKMHGEGKLTLNSGDIVYGLFKNGNLVRKM